ncbi:MAG: hypothetical protein M3O02_06860 [Acidobacteriota bacterium]|nr:hypothetical protein [Acidobacteriota bacterium]
MAADMLPPGKQRRSCSKVNGVGRWGKRAGRVRLRGALCETVVLDSIPKQAKRMGLLMYRMGTP